MKAILTFVFFIFISTAGLAQSSKTVVKVETNPAKVELNVSIDNDDELQKEVARLYRYKNSRVKKALKFRTKANRSKMA